MPNLRRILLLIPLLSGCALAQGDPAFQGDWFLNSSRSDNADPSEAVLHVEQTARELKWASHRDMTFVRQPLRIIPLDGSAGKSRLGNLEMNIRTKWEGDALLVSTLVSGAQSYSTSERWTKSRDGRTLTIVRTVVRPSGESESTLVYENPALSLAAAPASLPTPVPAPVPPPAVASLVVRSAPAENAPTPETVRDYVVTPGTRVLMRLTNAVNTKHTLAGDRVYLQTAVPVFVDRRLVIPAGSYVTGVVVESTRAGRVKGKSALNLRFESISLPNGTTRDLSSRAGSVEGAGNLDRAEGRIQGEGNKSGDAKTVGKTTAAGAGIGTLAGAAAGSYGMGAGIGAAAGAVAGLAGVLGSRGPDVILHPGTTMEFVLDRELRFTDAELVERVR